MISGTGRGGYKLYKIFRENNLITVFFISCLHFDFFAWAKNKRFLWLSFAKITCIEGFRLGKMKKMSLSPFEQIKYVEEGKYWADYWNEGYKRVGECT